MKTLNSPARAHQSGAVLIVAMILLVVLTLLGVTTMNTSSLQERIASNTQVQTHAFQAAETGINQAFDDNLAFDVTCPESPSCYRGGATPSSFAGAADSASYETIFLGFTPPPPGSLYSATSFQAAHFNFRATGHSGNNVVMRKINLGAYQIAPKQ
ncbi:MAG: hypothetical protein GTO67_14620 [Gammaproteobacteria bacterium]|nr:hypothetical protein [Gammaproteobacteria bacterium]NIM72283.1 hypothetical protein [Gammaproteobacteria bacterium]NIN39793.1 hypothetical protein [Gammaproteobacteria bacterium]NIO24042.1 hypothetical protein [Gammaproteobacteria bacterium]NIO64692.1 hypothetical protein [Gammaproteobacteria bacterium]